MLETTYTIAENSIIANHLTYTHPYLDKRSFRRHFNTDLELIFFIRGNATYVIEDKKYKLNPGDLVIIRPSKYHYIQIDENVEYERYNFLFPVSLIGRELYKNIPHETEVISCKNDALIFDLFKKTDIYSMFGNEAFLDLFSGLMKELFYNLVYKRNEALSIPVSISPIVSRALEYINQNLYTIRDVEEISSALFVTEAYFYRIFKEQLKISPKKYITNKRLITAQRLIDKGERPTEVYQRCGFNTYTAFYKRYVEYFGHAPSDK